MTNPISGDFAAGDEVSFGDCAVWIDLNAESDFNLIDTWASEVSFTGEDIPTTQTYPFRGSAIGFTGVTGPATISITIVYTEGTDDAYHNIRTRFESASAPVCDVRWAPKGSASNNKNFTTSGGKLIACPPPTGAGDANTPNQVTFQVYANSVAMSTNA